MTDPPFLDEYTLEIAAPRQQVWDALVPYAASLGLPTRPPVTWVWAARPATGFEVVERVEGRLVALAGRHRFARYRLEFALDDAAGGTALHARSYAAFPGVPGRAYRALLLGTHGHQLATRHLLAAVRRRALRARSTRDR